jgi:hypothetical protein
MIVYLAGLIHGSVIDQCIAWRKQVVDYYSNWKGTGKPYADLCLIDPTNGEKDVALDGLSCSLPSRFILEKDYAAVKQSDLIVVNLNTFGVSRPPIGSICEIVFAWEHKKPVFAITTEDVYIRHPFISNMVSWYFESVEHMLKEKAIQSFYKTLHSAQY